MKSLSFLIKVVCGFGYFVLSSSGCTVIGLCGGILSDAQEPAERVFRPVAADSIEVGSTLYTVRTNGTTDTAMMAGVERVTSGGYQGQYRLWRSLLPDSVLIPAIGESILVVRDRLFGRTRHGKMAGWYRRGIVLSQATDDEETIQVTSIRNVSRGGQMTLTRGRLEELLSDATTPFVDDAANVRLISGMDTAVVRVQDFRSLRVPADKHAWRDGLLIGLGLDAMGATLVALLVRADRFRIDLSSP